MTAPIRGFPQADVIFSSADDENDSDLAQALVAAAKAEKPFRFPGEAGYWLITEIRVVDGGTTFEALGIPLAPPSEKAPAVSDEG